MTTAQGKMCGNLLPCEGSRVTGGHIIPLDQNLVYVRGEGEPRQRLRSMFWHEPMYAATPGPMFFQTPYLSPDPMPVSYLKAGKASYLLLSSQN